MDKLGRTLKHKLLDKFTFEATQKTLENELAKTAELMPTANVCPIYRFPG